MKKVILIIISIVIILVAGLFFMRSPEDDWIENDRGVWIKHGAPSETPEYVKEQQEFLIKVEQLYQEKKSDMQFESQCLGSIGDYAVDIVNVPRNELDNLPENQCEDYRQGKLNHFIELDKNGNIVRIK